MKYNEKLWQYTKTIKAFEQFDSFRTLIYYGKLRYNGKNDGTMEQNYGTIEKIKVVCRKLWNFDFLWIKLWYYSKL